MTTATDWELKKELALKKPNRENPPKGYKWVKYITRWVLVPNWAVFISVSKRLDAGYALEVSSTKPYLNINETRWLRLCFTTGWTLDHERPYIKGNLKIKNALRVVGNNMEKAKKL